MTEAIPTLWRAEAEELARVAGGDEAAFRRLYDAHHARVVRLAYGVLQDREHARDVAHDVMVKLLRIADRWRPQALIATWLRRVTLNECLSWRRRLLRRRAHAETLALEAAAGGAVESAHAEVQRTLAKRSLRDALASLRPRDRAIVVLHVDEDLGPQEIAAVLGISDNAARTALHRAIERLRTVMNATGETT